MWCCWVLWEIKPLHRSVRLTNAGHGQLALHCGARLVEQARDGIAGPHDQLIAQETRPARQTALAAITRNATITWIVKAVKVIGLTNDIKSDKSGAAMVGQPWNVPEMTVLLIAIWKKLICRTDTRRLWLQLLFKFISETIWQSVIQCIILSAIAFNSARLSLILTRALSQDGHCADE